MQYHLLRIVVLRKSSFKVQTKVIFAFLYFYFVQNLHFLFPRKKKKARNNIAKYKTYKHANIVSWVKYYLIRQKKTNSEGFYDFIRGRLLHSILCSAWKRGFWQKNIRKEKAWASCPVIPFKERNRIIKKDMTFLFRIILIVIR